MTDATDTTADGTANNLSGFSTIFDDESGDFSALDPPLFWPSVPAEEAKVEWEALRRWVNRLAERFELDFHALPRCWHQHNAYVEALCALRDYERASYADAAAATSAVDWHRAFRDIEARMREWSGRLACGARHEPGQIRQASPADYDWSDLVVGDVNKRRDRAVAIALEGSEC